MDGLPAFGLMGCGDGSVTFIEQYQITKNQALCEIPKGITSKPEQKGNLDVDQLSHVDHVTTNAHSSQVSPSCKFLKTTKL